MVDRNSDARLVGTKGRANVGSVGKVVGRHVVALGGKVGWVAVRGEHARGNVVVAVVRARLGPSLGAERNVDARAPRKTPVEYPAGRRVGNEAALFVDEDALE